MKALLVVLLVMLLAGCASQKALQMRDWNIEYLTDAMLELEVENDAYVDSLDAVRTSASNAINEGNSRMKTLGDVIKDFIAVTDTTVADSLLKKYNIKYRISDTQVLGE